MSVIAAVLFALAVLPATASATTSSGPASMTFSDRTIGTQSDPQIETVVVDCFVFDPSGECSSGADDRFTPNPVFTGANAGDFAQTNNCGSGISPVPAVGPEGVHTPGSCQFFIIFKPTSQGTRTATLTLGTSRIGAQSVSLSGVGTPTGQRAAALAKCKKKKKMSKKTRKKCKKKAHLLPV